MRNCKALSAAEVCITRHFYFGVICVINVTKYRSRARTANTAFSSAKLLGSAKPLIYTQLHLPNPTIPIRTLCRILLMTINQNVTYRPFSEPTAADSITSTCFSSTAADRSSPMKRLTVERLLLARFVIPGQASRRSKESDDVA